MLHPHIASLSSRQYLCAGQCHQPLVLMVKQVNAADHAATSRQSGRRPAP